MNAIETLRAGAKAIEDRAPLRDSEGNRSMRCAVDVFAALTGHELSEEDGWLFMAAVKLARSRGGRHHADDYTDGAAYVALAGEARCRAKQL